MSEPIRLRATVLDTLLIYSPEPLFPYSRGSSGFILHQAIVIRYFHFMRLWRREFDLMGFGFRSPVWIVIALVTNELTNS